MPYEIRAARREDLMHLQEIELAAARLLVGSAPESVLGQATSPADFEHAQEAGLLWVAAIGDTPVGFAHVKLIEPDSAHLDELDVHPAHGRQGLGRRLVTTVCEWATGKGLSTVTLSTFRHLPWNMPFYASLGFAVIPSPDWSAALTRLADDETRRGLDRSRRVIMRRRATEPLISRR